MIAFIARIVCRWRGHAWGKASVVIGSNSAQKWKTCRRCGETAPVKMRLRKTP